MSNTKYENGKKYGQLTVLARYDYNEPSNRCIKWVCQCSCGRKTIVNGNNLRTGRVKSCGQCDKQLRGNQHE